MPIYEFYCKDCHTIFNFFSKTVNTKKVPGCPKCRNPKLTKQVSLFAVTGRAEENSMDELPVDASKMEKAMEMMAKESENINEDDPRQAAKLMRKLTDMTGVGLGQGMEEALHRIENGEDPEKIEAEMGDLMGDEDPFILPGKKSGKRLEKNQAPRKDDTLYDL
ncbi:MAG: zinc ribbon domain-containing protein [Desulfobacteraceae bacterium]|nr:zinc ribbon domain-containing protein [Desulfobacteraceae bacterium]